MRPSLSILASLVLATARPNSTGQPESSITEAPTNQPIGHELSNGVLDNATLQLEQMRPVPENAELPVLAFAVPPLDHVRAPIAISADLASICHSLSRNLLPHSSIVSLTQTLLMHRMLLQDSMFEPSDVECMHDSFGKAYQQLYNPRGTAAAISEDTKRKISDATATVLALRTPLVALLHDSWSRIDVGGLAAFIQCLRTTQSELALRRSSRVPEERLLMDMLEALSGISQRVVQVLRERRNPTTSAPSGPTPKVRFCPDCGSAV